jgi:hypothetical protein
LSGSALTRFSRLRIGLRRRSRLSRRRGVRRRGGRRQSGRLSVGLLCRERLLRRERRLCLILRLDRLLHRILALDGLLRRDRVLRLDRLLGGGGLVVLRTFDGILEAAQSLANCGSGVGQPTRADDDQHYHENDYEMGWSQSPHNGFSLPPSSRGPAA